MKKILRAIARLFVAGAVSAGALFAAVKLGPRVATKLGPLLHRAPATEADGELDSLPAVPPATDDAPRSEHLEPMAPAEPTPVEELPSVHPSPHVATE